MVVWSRGRMVFWLISRFSSLLAVTHGLFEAPSTWSSHSTGSSSLMAFLESQGLLLFSLPLLVYLQHLTPEVLMVFWWLSSSPCLSSHGLFETPTPVVFMVSWSPGLMVSSLLLMVYLKHLPSENLMVLCSHCLLVVWCLSWSPDHLTATHGLFEALFPRSPH